MPEVTITADMVMEVVACRRNRAANIAAYATHRFAGLRPVDAGREAGIGEVTLLRFERLLPTLCDHFGLPDPCKTAPNYSPRDLPGASERGRHQRWHVGRGQTNPACRLCNPGGR